MSDNRPAWKIDKTRYLFDPTYYAALYLIGVMLCQPWRMARRTVR